MPVIVDVILVHHCIKHIIWSEWLQWLGVRIMEGQRIGLGCSRSAPGGMVG